MKLILLVVTLAAAVTLAAVALAATPAATPAAGDPPQVAQLKKQVRDLRGDKADLQDTIRALRSDKADLRLERDAQDAVIEDQADTITRLRSRLANQPDPLDVITSRNPDGLWAAAQAIWREFPTLGAGSLCGFDKARTDSADLIPDSITFYRWTSC